MAAECMPRWRRCEWQGLGLRVQRKNRDGRVCAADLGRHLVVIPAHESRDHGDVLFAAQGVTDHAAHDWAHLYCACRGPCRRWHRIQGSLRWSRWRAASDHYAANHGLAGLISPARRAIGGGSQIIYKAGIRVVLSNVLPQADAVHQSIAPIGACTAEFSPVVGAR